MGGELYVPDGLVLQMLTLLKTVFLPTEDLPRSSTGWKKRSAAGRKTQGKNVGIRGFLGWG
jgi:hypothetical protein